VGLTRADLQDPNISDKDKAEIAVVLARYQSNDVWVNKLFKKVGVLLTSHVGNRLYLKASVESHKKLGYWIALAYDNCLDPDIKTIDYNNVLPAKDVLDNVNTFIITSHQKWGGVLFPFVFLLKFGVNALLDFEYIFCANGDMVLEKPEGFDKLFELLGDNDLIGYASSERSFSTGGFLAKTTALKQIIQHVEAHFLPFENYEKYTQEFGNAEGRFARAIKDLNLKVTPVEPPFNEQLHKPGFGTWYETLRFRHIHGEMNFSYRHKSPPIFPFYKYLDERFLGDADKKYLKLYEETKDKNVLENWYAKD
jgi:hypothetical protein